MTRKSKRIIYSVVLTVVTALTAATRVAGQPKAKPAEDVWYMHFTVTIKGNGTKRPDPRKPNEKVTWSIDRTYTRFTTIKPTGYSPGSYESDNPVVLVTLNDRYRIYTKGNFQHSSIENVDVRTHRKGSGMEPVKEPAGMKIVYKDKRCFVGMGLDPIGAGKNGVFISQTIVERSEYGFGLKPPLEISSPKSEPVRLGGVRFPTVSKGDVLLLYGSVRILDKPMPKDDRDWEFNSEPLEPDEPLLTGIPESKTDVKITVNVKLSRKPLY